MNIPVSSFQIQRYTREIEQTSDSFELRDINSEANKAYFEMLYLLSPDTRREKAKSPRQKRVRGVIKNYVEKQSFSKETSVVGRVIVSELLAMDITDARRQG